MGRAIFRSQVSTCFNLSSLRSNFSTAAFNEAKTLFYCSITDSISPAVVRFKTHGSLISARCERTPSSFQVRTAVYAWKFRFTSEIHNLHWNLEIQIYIWISGGISGHDRLIMATIFLLVCYSQLLLTINSNTTFPPQLPTNELHIRSNVNIEMFQPFFYHQLRF